MSASEQEELERLRKKNEKLIEEIKQLEDKKKELEKEINNLKHQLALFKNPHTPPSKQLFSKKTIQTPRKLGAPRGHRGATRILPEPTETEEHFMKRCPHCNDILGKPIEIEERIIEEIPEPQPIRVIKHIIAHYHCKNCGKITAPMDLPQDGNFGKNLLAQTAIIRYEDRLPIRKTANTLNRQYGLALAHTTILNIIQRVVQKLRTKYQELALKIRNAFNVCIDETGIKVFGKQFWIWIFTTATDTFFVIRKSRHCKIVDEVLGENFKGIINCDGWQAYKTYKTKNKKVLIQRCWAHALREVGAVAEKYSETKDLHEWFKNIFNKVCSAREKKVSMQSRIRIKKNLEVELQRWLAVCKPYKEMKTVRTKIENGFNDWFTCVIHPEIEPTNNHAERMLREQVVLRKISGCLRNEKGITANETIMSLITTWRQNGLNPFTELRAAL